MDNPSIRERAKQIADKQNNLFKTLLIVSVISSLVGVIPSLFDHSIGGIITLIFTIIMVPFSHGYIVSSLKEVNNRDDLIDPEKDSLVGIYRFKELFSTYFIKEIIMIVVIIIIALVTMYKFFMSLFTLIGYFTFDALLYTTNVGDILTQQDVILFFMGLILILIFTLMYTLYFALVPYLLEKYNYKNFDAMKESARLMKGYKEQYFKLNFSYFFLILLAVLIVGVITNFFSMFCPPLITSIIMAFVSSYFYIYVYEMKLTLARAIFFEEIDNKDKQNNQ